MARRVGCAVARSDPVSPPASDVPEDIFRQYRNDRSHAPGCRRGRIAWATGAPHGRWRRCHVTGQDCAAMTLADRLPPLLPNPDPDADPAVDPDALYTAFETWAGQQGLTLYPHQEEALL